MRVINFIRNNFTSILLLVVVLSSSLNSYLLYQRNFTLREELIETKIRYQETRELHLELADTYVKQREYAEAQTKLIRELVEKIKEVK